jgi:hypothetical protein
MDIQSQDIRALSADECAAASGGLGWFVVIAVLAGSAGAGAALAILTKSKEEEVLVPKLDLPD